MKIVTRIIIGLHMYVGLGALFGGISAVLNPEKPLGISTDMLANSPFTNYLVPGLFLILVLGFGNIGSSVLSIMKIKHNGISSGSMGGILVLWIVIQCYVLQTIDVLHVVFFVIGMLQSIFACMVLYANDEFPVSLAKKFVSNIIRRKSMKKSESQHEKS